MPKCFIQTSRNYNGRMPPEKDEKTKNHHRTVTRSGRRYIKPALPKLTKSRRSPDTRCRDRLEDFQSPSTILQRCQKLSKKKKCNPWSQLSVVTRFYLGRQLPELDVAGLKPRDRPVWPDDFPCSHWPLSDEYPLRSDQARSPFEDESDDVQANKPRLKFTDLKPILPSKKYIAPIPQRHGSTLSPACQESLKAIRLNPGIKRKNDCLVYPMVLSEKKSVEYKISEMKNSTFPNGTILGKCKVFKITPQSGPVKETLSEMNPVLRIKLQEPPRNQTPTSTATNVQPCLNFHTTSVWNKPQANSNNMAKTPDVPMEDIVSETDKSNNNTAEASKEETKPTVSSLKADMCCSATSNGDAEKRNSLPPVIKIITTPKSGKNEQGHYKCEDCDRVFTVLSALTSHIRTHAKERNACDECGKVFTRSWLLKGHMRTHTGERPFNCPEAGCDKAFADKSNLRSHLLIHTVTTKSFVCPKCGRAFAQKRYLHKHMLEVCRTVPDNF